MKKMKPTISQRQAEILKIIVQEYISNAQPVGSKRILTLLNQSVSTATIRKECATLEELGFLEKEHTSSGRVPSSKGYRYYVDHLMATDQIDKKVFQQLNALFDDRSKSIDLIINESTKMLSELTNLIVVVSQKNVQEDLKIQRIELIPLTSSTAAIVFILSNGEIIKKVYPLDATTMKDLKISIGLFNDNLAGTKLTDLTNNSAKAQQIISQSVKQYDTLFQKLLNGLAEEVGDHSRSYGLKNALINPEFSDTKKVERMLAIIEDISPFDWFNFSYQTAKNEWAIETKIGDEAKELLGEDYLSMVAAEFNLMEGQVNAITLIGPKRMKYDEANVLLKYLIDKINGFKK